MARAAFAARDRVGRRAMACAAGVLGIVVWTTSPSAAQSLSEVKDAMEMMVSSASICSDYLQRPEVLADTRSLGLRQLTGAGLSEGEADEFMDGVVAAAKAETLNETQKQVACEIVNIKALPE